MIGQGFVLGADYGVKLFDEEEMQVELTFELPAAPLSAYFDFFHCDTVDSCIAPEDSGGVRYGSLFKKVYVNGTNVEDLVWSESIAGDQDVEHFQQDIAPDLTEGTNTIYAAGFGGGGA